MIKKILISILVLVILAIGTAVVIGICMGTGWALDSLLENMYVDIAPDAPWNWTIFGLVSIGTVAIVVAVIMAVNESVDADRIRP